MGHVNSGEPHVFGPNLTEKKKLVEEIELESDKKMGFL